MKKIHRILTATMFVFSIFLSFYAVEPVFAATAGCYKIANGEPTLLSGCPLTNAVYDNGNGVNISRPDPAKCYIYSQNLYDGDTSWGDPYVEVPCTSLSACPSGQELRYSDAKLGAPECVSATSPTSGQFAGGAQPANSATAAGPIDVDCESDGELTTENCGIVRYLVSGINFLSALAGMAIVASIIIAGFQYMTARDNSGQIEAAKKRIIWAFVALGVMIFMYGFLQWVVPGGVL